MKGVKLDVIKIQGQRSSFFNLNQRAMENNKKCCWLNCDAKLYTEGKSRSRSKCKPENSQMDKNREFQVSLRINITWVTNSIIKQIYILMFKKRKPLTFLVLMRTNGGSERIRCQIYTSKRRRKSLHLQVFNQKRTRLICREEGDGG
ncbi:unnamed protein product [Paramecium octaurelia]|uniref:Uncharacterized protein n=1 Tax=Paramecium octaurelia TaxID=43137 RepID=A0A8S1S9W5_PAROT|nr:unnamed protein product [Paramecium octaurelia]